MSAIHSRSPSTVVTERSMSTVHPRSMDRVSDMESGTVKSLWFFSTNRRFNVSRE